MSVLPKLPMGSGISSKVDVLEFRSHEIPDVYGLQEYIAEVSSSFCPFIRPSVGADKIRYTLVSSEAGDEGVAQEIVFACGYALTELLRNDRALSLSGQRAPLLCDNVIFLLPNISEAMGKQLLGWPHWLLKSRYTEIGLLFGKFWKGAREKSKDQRDLPIPPCHFLSIRESVRSKDPKFFMQADWLLPSLESAQDIGQNVFDDLTENEGVAQSLRALRAQPSSSGLALVVAALIEGGFYPKTKRLAAAELRAREPKDSNPKTRTLELKEKPCNRAVK